jgi:hypothetical protein
MSKIDQQVRETFAGIADILIPEAEGMPSASAVGVHEAQYLDRILGLRPDLAEAFFRGIQSAQGREPRPAAEKLHASDESALGAIGLIASSAYYMSPRVRELIGYPGQTSRPFDPDETPEYLTNGMLKRVLERGPIFREIPRT